MTKIDIRAERRARHLTLERLAELAGFSVSTLGMVERVPGLITPAVARRLAEVLGLPVDALLALAATRNRDAFSISPLTKAR